MPRGNWGVGVAALCGIATIAFGAGSWLTSLYYDPSDRHPSYQQEAGQVSIAAAPASARPAIQTLEKKEPCIEPQGKDESDLCAQWRAAKAGERAAFWALVQMVLSAFGIVGLAATLWFTRDALKAARESNSITRDAAGKQLRPYLGVEQVYIKDSADDAWFIIKNFGATPAYGVIVETVTQVSNNEASTYFHEFGIVDPSSTRNGRVVFGGIYPFGGDFVQHSVSIDFLLTYRGADEDGWIRTATFRASKNRTLEDGKVTLYLVRGTSREVAQPKG